MDCIVPKNKYITRAYMVHWQVRLCSKYGWKVYITLLMCHLKKSTEYA
jgi:hypothetical protein